MLEKGTYFVFHFKLHEWPLLYFGGFLVPLTLFNWVYAGKEVEWEWNGSAGNNSLIFPAPDCIGNSQINISNRSLSNVHTFYLLASKFFAITT